VSQLVSRVEQAVQAQNIFQRNQFILVAVSGGLDSMVLLHVLHRLADRYGWELGVAHFNHQLRGSASDEDEEFVRKTTAQLGLKFISGKADVGRFARKHRLSIEMAGRKLRHDFLAQTSLALDIKTIALAHHADDQVELFFLRLLRGAGGEGLAGMKWISPSPGNSNIQLARPLLKLFKHDLQSFAEREKIGFRPDATNAQLDTERNQIRNELLPLLRQKYQPALAKTTLRLMEIIGAESDLAQQAAKAREYQDKDTPFGQLHLAVQRQCLNLELRRLNIAPEFALIERLRSEPGSIIMVNSRLAIWRDQDGKIQSRPVSSIAFNKAELMVDLSAHERRADFGGLLASWQIEERRGTGNRTPKPVPFSEYFDADKVGVSVCLRHWLPGDRFQPIGMPSAAKLQNLFINCRIPRVRRHQLVVGTTLEGEIFWVEGLRISAQFKLTNQTVRVLKWSWLRL
jgi:tRNA(Ile)-lysidine synthase